MKKLLVILILISVGQVSAQNFTRSNLYYYYSNKSDIQLDYQITTNKNEAFVYLKVTNNKTKDLFEEFSLMYAVKSNYAAPFTGTVVSPEKLLSKSGKDYYFKLQIPLETAEVVCEVRLENKSTKRIFAYDIPIESKHSIRYADFMVKDAKTGKPYFGNYLSKEKKVVLASENGGIEKLYCFKYNFDFEAATPPMSLKASGRGKSMEIDSVFSVNTNDTISFAEKGLYFFQKDTTKIVGLSIKVTDKYYPKLAKVEDLIASTVYISTRLEIRKLTDAENKKKAMDRFWIKITNAKSRAKNIIRAYYGNVKRANDLFTNYKDGWKTDQGMIFTIFGLPHQVFRDGNAETWVYIKKEDRPKLKFIFIKEKNIFTKSHYKLKRDKSYEKYWYRTIDLWRKGRIGL